MMRGFRLAEKVKLHSEKWVLDEAPKNERNATTHPELDKIQHRTTVTQRTKSWRQRSLQHCRARLQHSPSLVVQCGLLPQSMRKAMQRSKLDFGGRMRRPWLCPPFWSKLATTPAALRPVRGIGAQSPAESSFRSATVMMHGILRACRHSMGQLLSNICIYVNIYMGIVINLCVYKTQLHLVLLLSAAQFAQVGPPSLELRSTAVPGVGVQLQRCA